MAKNSGTFALKWFCVSFLFWTQANAQDGWCDQPLYECCAPYECCNRFFAEAEYLYWKIQGSPNPVPFIATAPIEHNMAPLIGEPGAVVVLGGKKGSNNWRSGGRFTLGYWLNECCYGAEASYFFLPERSRHQEVFSSGLEGSPYLSVPYFNTETGRESSSPVATPGMFRGLARLKINNRMQGAELNGLGTLFSGCSCPVNVLVGFRYWNFNESLNFNVNSPAFTIPGEVYKAHDRFRTINNFYGGQIGLATEYCACNGFYINAKGKVALGAMCEEVKIQGKFITNAFDGFEAPETFSGGYFGLLSNKGRHKRTCFAVIPEVNVNLGYQFCNCLRIQIGYTFLYANKVLFAGKQVNRNINPTQSALYEFTPTPTLVGTARPKASLKNNSIWAQGLNVGLEYQF